MSLLAINDLAKAYGSLKVTRDVSLEIEPGERHVIIGPNGAGKTSLLNQIGGQLPSDSGSILFRGKEVTRLLPEEMCRRGLARTFQKNNLFQNLTVLENVRLGVQAKHGSRFDPFMPVRRLADQRRRAEAALDQVHLLHRARTEVCQLSYGEQRQLEIACALACEPILLLLDEPTSGLSSAETRQIIELIKFLPRDITILMIEHDFEVVFAVADRITVLHFGAVLATGTPEEVRGNPAVREIYLGLED
jgi:branched-chain amino acid transport system ATP-binding protein